MKNAHGLVCSLIVMALAIGAEGQPAATSDHAGSLREPPTGDYLVLSNAAGMVRVLDSKGLVLEKNQVYLPRIQLADLSPAELQALLETRTAYAGLTTFGSAPGTNVQGAAMERQLQRIWHDGRSLAEKMQTRLEILADLREYNYNLAFLPGSMAVASQYNAQAAVANDRLTTRGATVVAAAAQVEATELNRADGPASELAEQQAQENYRELVVRVEKANDRANIANAQAANANKQVMDYQANCVAISTRLAGLGIHVPGAPTFYPVPPLTLQAEVDAERKAN
ncbi:MAG: hypothetical protein WAO02_18355 [Verrucomicrobiia bacterium]